MYKIITTPEEVAVFKNIWSKASAEAGWLDDPYYHEAVRYFILHNSHKNVIGTIEFVPCTKIPIEKLNYRYSSGTFSKHTVWEIDRVTLVEGYRKKGFMKYIFNAIKHHYTTYQPEGYIGLMDKKFYDNVQRFCGNDLKKTGPVWRNQNSALVPVYFPVKEIFKRKKYIYYAKIAFYYFYLNYKKLRIKWVPGLKLRKVKKRIDMFFIKN